MRPNMMQEILHHALVEPIWPASAQHKRYRFGRCCCTIETPILRKTMDYSSRHLRKQIGDQLFDLLQLALRQVILVDIRDHDIEVDVL